MTAIEITRFRVDPARADELVAARAPMLAAFRAHRPAVLSADLVRIDESTWVDLVRWASRADFDAAQDHSADPPEMGAFFAVIAELISMEVGEVAA
jgi:quinol monooxygenase YgiN